jgi:S1-C subfamily serine protease
VDGGASAARAASAQPPASTADPSATARPPARAASEPHVVIIAAGIVAVALVVAAGLLAFSWMKSKAGQTSASAAAVAAAAPVSALSAPADLGEPPPVPPLVQLLAPPAGDTSAPLTIEEVVTRALPAVVKVETRDGIGSGFFVSPDTLLTNAHVVGSETSVTLRLSRGEKKTATVENVWRQVDLAILKTDVVDLEQVVLPIAAPADVRVGAEVVAIGSPLGLQNTVTRGIISGMRMYMYDRITPQGMEVVQTDAAINPGNSGGPLIDRHGRVVGVNTLKLQGGAERLGFAVQMHYARRLLGPAFTLKSATERRRDDGLHGYDGMIRRLAQYVDEVDARWQRFRPHCVRPAAEPPVAREWFALRNGGAASVSEAAACQAARGYFVEWAHLAHDALEQYNEDAREAGVPPATLRTIRRTHNMAWPAWEK